MAPAKRQLFEFSPEEVRIMKKRMRNAMAKSKRRKALREKARKILRRYDTITFCDVPTRKREKLIAAAGWLKPRGWCHALDESVEDMDRDSYFGNFSMENDERQAILDDRNDEIRSQENLPNSIVVLAPENAPVGEKKTPKRAVLANIQNVDENSPTPLEVLRLRSEKPSKITMITDFRANADKNIQFPAEFVQEYLLFIKNDPDLSRFLRYDYCNLRSDKYLLAVVCVYFARTKVRFSSEAFYNFLFLANETHEDEDELRLQICAWIFHEEWPFHYHEFMEGRLGYWLLLNFETVVLRQTLEQIFAVDPKNKLWARERCSYHAGAMCRYIRDELAREFAPKGPFETPTYCDRCVSRMPKSALPTVYQGKRDPSMKRRLQYNRTPAAPRIEEADC